MYSFSEEKMVYQVVNASLVRYKSQKSVLVFPRPSNLVLTGVQPCKEKYEDLYTTFYPRNDFQKELKKIYI